MDSRRFAICTAIAALFALAACASSPEAESRRMDMEADIDEILSYELDKTEFGDPKNCLFENEYRSFRPLGDRHLLFEGRRGEQWVNVLRGRCTGLDDNGLFVMRQTMPGRTCDKDRFDVVDRFGSSLSQSVGMGPTCVLGEFKPVAKAQLQEIEARLEMR
jgi:hypothetical protein